MPVKLTPGLIKTIETYLESMDEYSNLVRGLQIVMWTYLEDHIDGGVDAKINGNFLRNFDNLLELFHIIEEYDI